jgi:hypothetical protein
VTGRLTRPTHFTAIHFDGIRNAMPLEAMRTFEQQPFALFRYIRGVAVPPRAEMAASDRLSSSCVTVMPFRSGSEYLARDMPSIRVRYRRLPPPSRAPALHRQ